MRIGEQLAGHEIIAKLSSGGMATLYLGRKQGAGGFAKHVAIKVVHAHLAEDPSFVEMFLDEARLSARIEHPNVVHVHDLGEHEGNYFMVMEFVAGCSLAQLLKALAKKKLKLAPEVAVAIAIKVASALHAAHELTDSQGNNLGVVHRDVSPQNVLLAFKGHVKLIDFGIAKAADRSQQTQGSVFKGKIRYAAPEQAMGKALDRRADIYAVGILLWEMLTTHRLFDGDSDFEVLEQVRNPSVRAPGTVVSGISPALDRAVLEALHPDPNQRPQTADELRKRLAQACPGALEIDAPHLADLLGVLMQEFVETETRKLGSLSTISQIMGGVAPSADAAELVERLVGPIAQTKAGLGSSAPTSVPRLVPAPGTSSAIGARLSRPMPVAPPRRNTGAGVIQQTVTEHGALALDQHTELSPIPFPLEGEASKIKASPLRDEEIEWQDAATKTLDPVAGGVLSGALRPGSQYPRTSPYLQPQNTRTYAIPVAVVVGALLLVAGLWVFVSRRRPVATPVEPVHVATPAPLPVPSPNVARTAITTPVVDAAPVPAATSPGVAPEVPRAVAQPRSRSRDPVDSTHGRGSAAQSARTRTPETTQVRGRFGQRQTIVGPDDL